MKGKTYSRDRVYKVILGTTPAARGGRLCRFSVPTRILRREACMYFPIDERMGVRGYDAFGVTENVNYEK